MCLLLPSPSVTPAPWSPPAAPMLPANLPWPLHPRCGKLADFSFWSRNPCPFSIAPCCVLCRLTATASLCVPHTLPLPSLSLGCVSLLSCVTISVSPSHAPCLISGYVDICLYLSANLSFSGTNVSGSRSDFLETNSEPSLLMLLSSAVTATLHTCK